MPAMTEIPIFRGLTYYSRDTTFPNSLAILNGLLITRKGKVRIKREGSFLISFASLKGLLKDLVSQSESR